MSKIITRNIFILSIVSLFTDIASEMLYPVMPVYLSTIGFSVIWIGLLEGAAEATAGLSKGYFGNYSDHKEKRLPFVQLGYTLSAISKPLMVLFSFPVWVFFARTLDRFGKGVRTGARDALLSDEATPETKGRVFGFHRTMDTFGAVLGPLLALLYLAYKPEDYRTLFFIAFFPGITAIVFTLFIKEKKRTFLPEKKKIRWFDFIRYWKSSPVKYKKLVGALLIFTLFNSSDVFLLLKIKETGAGDAWVIGTYVFYNLVYALFSYPAGALADRLGMKTVLSTGLLLFSLTYFGMSYFDQTWLLISMFFIYGLYSATTEGIAKAWISNICEKEHTATAIGTYTAFQSVATLLASSLAGFIWYTLGSSFTFFVSALIAMLVSLFLFRLKSTD